MTRIKPFMMAGLLAIALTACDANFHSIHREDNFTTGLDSALSGEVILTDGKQRSIVATPAPTKDNEDELLVVCKERYPDLFSALASSGSGSVDYQKIAAAIALGTSGSTGFAGLRTQLRETQASFLEFVCTAYAAGALTKDEVARHLRLYQNTLTAQLAIEQLTGYAQPTLAAVGQSSAGSTGKDVVAITESLKQARAQLVEAETTQTTEQAEYDTIMAGVKQAQGNPGASDEAALKAATKEQKAQIEKAVGELAAATRNVADARANVAAIETALATARTSVEASTSAAPANIGAAPAQAIASMHPDSVAWVSWAVTRIVQNTQAQHFTAEWCQRILAPPMQDFPMEAYTNVVQTGYAPGSTQAMCINYLNSLAPEPGDDRTGNGGSAGNDGPQPKDSRNATSGTGKSSAGSPVVIQPAPSRSRSTVAPPGAGTPGRPPVDPTPGPTPQVERPQGEVM